VNLNTDLSFPGYPIEVLTFIFFLSYCIVFIRRDRYSAFFAFSALISAFIAMGPNSPFSSTFIWAWYNIPYFAVFRAISRWIMMAALSHVFFISLMVANLTAYLQKLPKMRVSNIFFTVEAMRGSAAQTKKYQVSVEVVNKLVRKIRGLFSYLGIIVLILVFVSPVLANFYLVSQSLQVYTLSQGYIAPHIWLSGQSGDYRIVTVGENPVDFANVAATTELGGGHDIGYESAFIHDKPVLQNGGWEPLSRAFVDYLRYEVVPNNTTDNLARILGAFNYRYVVLPPYASGHLRNFFLNQKNTQTVYDSGSIILESNECNQRIFGTTQNAIIIGDLEVISTLYKLPSFNLNTTTLFFANQMKTAFFNDPLFNKSRSLVFSSNSLLSAVMLSLKEDPCILKVGNQAVNSRDPSVEWILSPSWRKRGKFLFSDNTLHTSGKSSIHIPFKIEKDGTYSIYARVGFAPSRGLLSFLLDGGLLKSLRPSTKGPYELLWVKLGNLNLKSGDHFISLLNDGSGPNDVDAIAVVETSILEKRKEEVIKALDNFKGRLVYILEAEKELTFGNVSTAWVCRQVPYNDFVLHSEGVTNISVEGNASASSIESRLGNVPQFANDGNPLSRWASGSGMPQWLKIEWPTPRKIEGVRIIFEKAYAEDYLLQVWNGTSWVTQVPTTW